MAVRHVLFDVAGTLVHKPDVPRAVADTLRNFGADVAAPAVADALYRLAETRVVPPETTRAFYLRFNRELAQALGAPSGEDVAAAIYAACRGLPWRAFDDVTALRRIRRPVGIVSNWDSRLSQVLAETVGMPFDPVVVSADEGVAKPDLRIYELAVRRCGLRAEECAYVGDSVVLDLEPARRAGLSAFLVDRSGRHPAAPHVVGSLHELVARLDAADQP
jgi:putative hydrolase of the HAD superfamily